MSSADTGAPRVRPADVERWLAELGLEPVERADRDGIASWDLVLDGRRRFDLRVTVILDPALAVIVLGALRAADQRHVPQVVPQAAALERRVPVREVLASARTSGRSSRSSCRSTPSTPTRSAWPSPASSASPTACSTSRRAGCGSAARPPEPADRVGPQRRRSSTRYADRLPDARRADGRAVRTTAAVTPPRSGASRRSSSRSSSRSGCWRARRRPPRSAPRRRT